MSEGRWIAPQDGYYRIGLGNDPVFLGAEPPEGEAPGDLLRIEVTEHEVRGYQNSGGNLRVLDQMIPDGTWTTLPGGGTWTAVSFDSDPVTP